MLNNFSESNAFLLGSSIPALSSILLVKSFLSPWMKICFIQTIVLNRVTYENCYTLWEGVYHEKEQNPVEENKENFFVKHILGEDTLNRVALEVSLVSNGEITHGCAREQASRLPIRVKTKF